MLPRAQSPQPKLIPKFPVFWPLFCFVSKSNGSLRLMVREFVKNLHKTFLFAFLCFCFLLILSSQIQFKMFLCAKIGRKGMQAQIALGVLPFSADYSCAWEIPSAKILKVVIGLEGNRAGMNERRKCHRKLPGGWMGEQRKGSHLIMNGISVTEISLI